MRKSILAVLLVAAAAVPGFSQTDIKDAVIKHLKTGEEFTVKVAEAMPEADYGFKLTTPQMSFGGQLVHLANALNFILSPFSGQQPQEQKATSKADIIKLIHDSYEHAIGEISELTPEQLAKTYTFEGHKVTGVDLLLSALDHSTQHRASAEMYLRAKGITPPLYEF